MPSRRHEALYPAPVCGVDEAGRGPLAGPVVAAAVILPERGCPRGLDDSKKLAPPQRHRLHARLMACAVVGVGIVEADEIDRPNRSEEPPSELQSLMRNSSAVFCLKKK